MPLKAILFVLLFYMLSVYSNLTCYEHTVSVLQNGLESLCLAIQHECFDLHL